MKHAEKLGTLNLETRQQLATEARPLGGVELWDFLGGFNWQLSRPTSPKNQFIQGLSRLFFCTP